MSYIKADCYSGLHTWSHKQVLLQAGTERSGTGMTVNGYSGATKEEGMWVSAVSGVPLFPSSTKVSIRIQN
jgi:peptide methionine sulfoxide reductase MsrB